VNDDELQRHLSHLQIPTVTNAARERARFRAALALNRAEVAPTAERAVVFWRWTTGMLAIALAVALTWQMWPHPSSSREDVAADQKVLQQMQALFPHQVNAVVVENGKVDLSVTQSPAVGSDQPIVIVFRRDDKIIRVLSYSGHHVCLPLGGREHCFEILATTNGGVILEEADNAWLAANKPEIAGFSVQAQSLEAPL
jgi:hypothetical protein